MSQNEPCPCCKRMPVETLAEAAARLEWLKLGSLEKPIHLASECMAWVELPIRQTGWILSWAMQADFGLMIDRVVYAQLLTTVRSGPVEAAAYGASLRTNAPSVELLHVTKPANMAVLLRNPHPTRLLTLSSWGLYGITSTELRRAIDDPALGPWLRSRYGSALPKFTIPKCTGDERCPLHLHTTFSFPLPLPNTGHTPTATGQRCEPCGEECRLFQRYDQMPDEKGRYQWVETAHGRVLHDQVTGKPPPGWGSPEDAVCPICRVAISELPDHHEHVEVTDEDEREERA